MVATNNDSEEFDLEVDIEDLPSGAPVSVHAGSPAVIVDDLHVKYHVVGSKRVSKSQLGKKSPLTRFLQRGRALMGGQTEIHAIRGVSFVARHGESIGLIGTNGSGKSTLLKAIAGLLEADSGAVYVSGTSSLLGVSAVLIPELSGARNVEIGGLALGLSKKEIAEKFDEIVEFSGLGDAIDLPMKTYSAGMGARLRFAISTSATPDILMVDEALATGDAGFRERSRVRIAEIQQEAGTVFMVTHSLASIKAMCNRVIWLDRGEIIMDGDPETVTAAYRAHTKKSRA